MTSSAAPARLLASTGADEPGDGRRTPSAAFARLTVLAAVATYLLIVAGGVVRVSGSGLGCGDTGSDWPLCHGRLVPPADTATVIEFTHRCFATLSSVLVIAVVLVAWTRYRHLRRIVIAASVAAVFFALQVVLGAVTVELKLAGPVVMVHLANAEFLLATLVFIAASTLVQRAQALDSRALRGARGTQVAPAARAAAARSALIAAGATYLLVLSGALVVEEGAGPSCSAWPLCGGGFSLDGSTLAGYNLFHRFVAGLVVLFAGFAMGRVLRVHRGVRSVRIAGMAASALLVLQVLAGALLVELRLPAWTRGVHLALATALWATIVLVALLTRPRLLKASAPNLARAEVHA